jgi:hypothetical protein
VFLKSERNKSTSRAILTITPREVDGLSILFAFIQGRDCYCPAVVGMRNGTGTRAHLITR